MLNYNYVSCTWDIYLLDNLIKQIGETGFKIRSFNLDLILNWLVSRLHALTNIREKNLPQSRKNIDLLRKDSDKFLNLCLEYLKTEKSASLRKKVSFSFTILCMFSTFIAL